MGWTCGTKDRGQKDSEIFTLSNCIVVIAFFLGKLWKDQTWVSTSESHI